MQTSKSYLRQWILTTELPIPTFARPNLQKKAVLPKKGRGGKKKILDTNFFFKNCFFLKIWPSKSGYRQVRRQNSLPWICFSGLYDASPARYINFCVLLLDLGRKKTSLRGGPTWAMGQNGCGGFRFGNTGPGRAHLRRGIYLFLWTGDRRFLSS